MRALNPPTKRKRISKQLINQCVPVTFRRDTHKISGSERLKSGVDSNRPNTETTGSRDGNAHLKGQGSQRSIKKDTVALKTTLHSSDMLITHATGSAIWTVSLKWHSGILCLRQSPVCALASFPVSCALSKHTAFVQQQQGKQTAGNNSFNPLLSYSRLRKTNYMEAVPTK